MTVYVDALRDWGWILRGRRTPSCHLFTDALDLAGLHALAADIGLRRAWFQNARSAPHYDLTPGKRAAAIAAGAVPLAHAEAVRVWRARRAAIEAAA